MTDTMHGSTFSSFSWNFSIMHGTNNKAKNVGPILSYKKRITIKKQKLTTRVRVENAQNTQ